MFLPARLRSPARDRRRSSFRWRNSGAAAMQFCAREGRRLLQLGSTDGYEPLKRALMEHVPRRRHERTKRAIADDRRLPAGDRSGLQGVSCGRAIRWRIENPAYPGAISILAGARVRTLAVNVESDQSRTGYAGLDVDALETVLMQNRVKFLLVTPDFHNPTGTSLAAGRTPASAGNCGALSSAGDRGCDLRAPPLARQCCCHRSNRSTAPAT